ncbi:TIGR00730 family Rossman fold protein [Methylophilus rhizosphaerae]|nr:TIGR00730 family Rossman fold protein [Methylophilus rhizosphaerae]
MTERVIRSVAVFCGSNFGASGEYELAAKMLSSTLAKEKITIVYGGTTKGLMGVVANAALEHGGIVHGIVTEYLHQIGQSHPSLTQHEITADLRARKERMIRLADAFIILPGGIGTIEELMEVWSMNQLEEIDKPVGLLNVNGFFSSFLDFIDHMIDSGFLPSAHKQSISVATSPSGLLIKLREFKKIEVPKWIEAR